MLRNILNLNVILFIACFEKLGLILIFYHKVTHRTAHK